MEAQQALNIVWALIAGFLMFFMQAGFAMVETGFTRAKNAGNIVIKNLMTFAVGALMFFIVGFALMFGPDYNGLIGTAGFFDPTSLQLTVFDRLTPEAFLFFQMMFGAVAVTVVSGAMSERTKLIAYAVIAVAAGAVIYPIAGHWVWGGGWLESLGFIDFAGSTVVHSVGGWAALIGAVMLGPRIGKYNRDGSVNAIPGHSLPLGALGVFILWFGWLGCCAGSTLSASAEIGAIALKTTLSGAASAIAVMSITWFRYKKPDISMTLNGVLGGLVAISAGCQVVTMWGAVFIGLTAGFIVTFGIEFLERICRVDDPVGTVAVHCFSGIWGTFAVGLFADYRSGSSNIIGLFCGGGVDQLGVQALGILSIAVWVSGSCALLFFFINKTFGLRVSKREEIEGLDVHELGSEAYADFMIRE